MTLSLSLPAMTPVTLRFLAAAGLVVVLPATPLSAQALPPIRPLGPVVRVSATDVLGSVSTVRPLPDGRVIVNDLVRRQVLLLDTAFAKELVIADTTAATANAYGARAAGLIPFRGDSSLFIDPGSLSMLVLDANGKVARVMAVPRPNDAQFMVGGPFGTPGFDPTGRIVYRGFTMPSFNGPRPQPGQPFTPPQMPDTAPILRVRLADRKLDTAGFFKIPMTKTSVSQSDSGQIRVSVVMNPMPVIDDWALLTDGTIAIVRGRDYHIDWLAVDGSITSSPKIPFDWQRMSDDDKTTFLDSARTAMEKTRAAAFGQGVAAGSGGAATMRMDGPPGGGGGGAMVMTFGGDGPGPRGGPGGGPGGGAPTTMRMSPPAINMVSASELPDYRPAFSTGAARGDAEGNLWIRTSKLSNGGPVYDVINRQGTLIDRVQLPIGRVIAGFRPGVVYMGVRDEKGARLEQARIK